MQTAKVIPIKTPYPKDKESARPFRLWDATKKQPMRWRCYLYMRNAHVGALIEARFAEVGTTIEVYDTRNGKLLGQYTRRPTSVTFLGA